jgi:hypothetical protein
MALDLNLVEEEAARAHQAATERLPARALQAPEELTVNLVVVLYDSTGICGYGVSLRDSQITGLRLDGATYQWFFHGRDRARSNRIVREHRPRITHKQIVLRSVRGGWLPRAKAGIDA